ncbi:MAG: RsfA family transcriptional regulator [Bacillales bacterium]|nr:RsfA family transcriptional regulator [Bacillales bacterium]
MKVRQDAWTEENDLLLAETVLRHVREGSTQLNAFEEVGDKLDRTSAACGFRWNSVVRHQYEQALVISRKQRKQRQRMLGIDQGGKKKLLYQPPTLADFETMEIDFDDENSYEEAEVEEKSSPTETVNASIINLATQAQATSSLNLENVISYLYKFRGVEANLAGVRAENERLRFEVKELSKRNQELESKIAGLQGKSNSIQEDYETLINIMNKARKLAMIEEEERNNTKFRMDRNGNLEKLAE